MYDCPTCSREFATQRDVRVHHAQVHDERLPNRTCAECGTEFHCEHERKYCSEECLTNAAPYAGASNPNYKGGKVNTKCQICERTFEYYPSDKEGLYCPSCVKEEKWRNPPKITGADNHRWNGGKVTRECGICGEPVERWPSQISDNAVLCSEECRAEWLSDTFEGEGHPNWEGGDPGPYGKGWANTRRQALERDGYECQICGATKDDLGRNPDVHHIIPVRKFVEDPDRALDDAHCLSNVVTLCIDCHRKADHGKITREALVTLVRE